MEKLIAVELEFQTAHLVNLGLTPIYSEIVDMILSGEDKQLYERVLLDNNDLYVLLCARCNRETQEADLADLSDIFLTLREFFSVKKSDFTTEYGKKYQTKLLRLKNDFFSHLPKISKRQEKSNFWLNDVALTLTYDVESTFKVQFDPEFYKKTFPNVRICLTVFRN